MISAIVRRLRHREHYKASTIARLTEANSRLQQQIEAQDSSYKQIMHSFMDIKRIIHDTNKQLIYIRACIEQGQATEGAGHISRILQDIEASCRQVATGNLAVDALVSHALSLAQELEITMEHRIQLSPQAMDFDRYDLCIVLGNLLDNAMEAAKQVRKSEDRSIQLQIHANNKALVIYTSNSIGTHGRTRDAKLRGTGLSNVQRVADKYGGHLKTAIKKGRYETVAVLPFMET